MAIKLLGVEKIISGAQSGVDLAGLIFAKSIGISTGGTMPNGFKTENGNKPEYETLYGVDAKGSYNERTKINIINSDGTLIIFTDGNSPGTKLTLKTCKELKKPYCYIGSTNLNSLLSDDNVQYVKNFIIKNKIKILNIAGNRESKSSGIQDITIAFLQKVFEE